MLIEENISLKRYNTFGLDYQAKGIIHIENERDMNNIRGELEKYQSFLVIGGGSNLLFTGDFEGVLLHPVIGGINTEKTENSDTIISAGSGIKWDNLVEWTVGNNLYGLENLSLIPGNVGASPVQNIGAYGTEISEKIEKVETIRLSDLARVSFSNDECGFEYRYSIFKGPEKRRYLVTRVFFRLSNIPRFNLEYGPVRDEVEKIGKITLRNVREAVISIRRSKLPDPGITGNAGSFFKNPVVPDEVARDLKKEYPGIPLYKARPGYSKIPAGWLIEQCGWKGKRIGDAGVHIKQALVIVNHGNATGMEIYNLSESLKDAVKGRFGISLEREVEIIGAI